MVNKRKQLEEIKNVTENNSKPKMIKKKLPKSI